MIARTLAQDTEIIVLDEPTAFLDLPNKYGVIHLLHTLAAERGRTIVFSTHDLNIAIQEADKIWLMLPGKIYQGSPEDLILDGSFGKMFEHTSLQFNTGKGEFRIKSKLRGTIGLCGQRTDWRWTRNALERIGYGVVDKDGQEIMITIENKKGERVWVLETADLKNKFASIYDLCIFLAGYSAGTV